jgi:hypothetical protein
MVARLARMGEAYWNEFVRGVQEGIAGRAEARYDVCRAGFNVRNIRTDRLAAAIERPRKPRSWQGSNGSIPRPALARMLGGALSFAGLACPQSGRRPPRPSGLLTGCGHRP